QGFRPRPRRHSLGYPGHDRGTPAGDSHHAEITRTRQAPQRAGACPASDPDHRAGFFPPTSPASDILGQGPLLQRLAQPLSRFPPPPSPVTRQTPHPATARPSTAAYETTAATRAPW